MPGLDKDVSLNLASRERQKLVKIWQNDKCQLIRKNQASVIFIV